jgi:hypothetical protein
MTENVKRSLLVGLTMVCLGCNTSNVTPMGWPNAWFYENEPFLRATAALVFVSCLFGLWLGARSEGIVLGLVWMVLSPLAAIVLNLGLVGVSLVLLMLASYAIAGKTMVLDFGFLSFCFSGAGMVGMLGYFATTCAAAWREAVLEPMLKRVGKVAYIAVGLAVGGTGLLLSLRDLYYVLTEGW